MITKSQSQHTWRFLQAVQHAKPRIPGPEAEDVPPQWSLKDGRLALPASPQVRTRPKSASDMSVDSRSPRSPARPMVPSQAFQALIDQLVNQHATELEALRAALARKDESPVLSPTLVTGMERMMTPTSNTSYPGQWRNKRLSSQSALVDANTILEAWDEQEHLEMRDIQNQTRLSTSESDPPTRSERCQDFLVSASYEGVMAAVLVANMLWMAWTVQVQGEQINLTDTSFGVGMEIWREIFYLVDAIFAGLYIGDACLMILGLGRRFWRTWMNCLDFVVAGFCVVEVFWLLSAGSSGVNFDFFRLLRVVKLTKALRMFSVAVGHAPLQLLVKCLEASRGMLFWSFCLLSLLQLLAGVVVSMLAAPYLLDDGNDVLMKEEVFRYYGTFSRTFLTMFEIMFANWGPACRVLVDNISEWFALFFLLYRCVFGFAVLNVVNSVFVQQTMKTATSDEELAFKQKEKDIAQYNRKVRKLFQTIDSSGDGAINLEEFEKLVQSPKLSFWMSQLELEYHDLLSLFEFLDNGDGQITLSEFIEGAGRLRGSAKAPENPTAPPATSGDWGSGWGRDDLVGRARISIPPSPPPGGVAAMIYVGPV
ncbi:Voltage-dependent P/Q-type calcium channel subunit alpha-1A [Symbiodinium microadriaticum]|uniref:Voltage-dependent P/Q-type calcium channel subunit alpha-1A n=1 Tax=Symbiodinium microadriaticum TaxID=2951 RepID=A0A1Q9CN91_SYMMI|nr:Voltage-dependent P/Q-type calcium channel subunit alpha-1A [Symbiodinium microadriaticum]